MDKTTFTRKDSAIELELEETHTLDQVPTFFTLPPELRTQIYNHIFDPEESHTEAFLHPSTPDHRLNETYNASTLLLPLLTNRQFHAEAHLLAFSRTTFAIRNPFTAKALPQRLRSRLPRASQIAAIRYIAFVAEADHFRQMRNWRGCAFGVPELRLHVLDILLYRSSYWHYLFDFNGLVVGAVRELGAVGRVRWCRNGGRVKPHFRTWFNRLVAALYKVDRFERFGAHGADVGAQRGSGGSGEFARGGLERVAWDWEFDDLAQTASLVARPAMRADLCVEEYDWLMGSGLKALARSVAVEEFDPDPRSRNGV